MPELNGKRKLWRRSASRRRLLCWCRQAASSLSGSGENGARRLHNRSVIPGALIGGVSFADLPPELSGRQGVDLKVLILNAECSR